MKIEILQRKHIPARNIQGAMKKIKTKFPHAKMITYKFDKDFKYDLEKDWENRTMTVLFIPDIKKLKKMWW
jgi:hypothetical protein